MTMFAKRLMLVAVLIGSAVASVVLMCVGRPEALPDSDVRVSNRMAGESTSTSDAVEVSPGSASETERQEVERESAPDKTTTISGRCIRAGQPLAEASMSFYVAAGPSDRAHHSTTDVKTSSDGKFLARLELADPQRINVTVRGIGIASRNATLGVVNPGVHIEVGDLVFPATGTILGRVTGAQGEPLSQAWLMVGTLSPTPNIADSLGGTWLPPATVRADSNGDYRITGLPPGEWNVEASADGVLEPVVKVALVPSGVTVREDFVLMRGPDVAGHVVDNAGAPIAGVNIGGFAPGTWNRTSTEAVTGSDGAFRVTRPRRSVLAPMFGRNIPSDVESEIEIHIIDPEYNGASVRARWGDQDVRLTVVRRGRIALRVLEDATGLPIIRYGYRIGSGGGIGQWHEVAAEDGAADIALPDGDRQQFLTVIPDREYESQGPIAVVIQDAMATPVEVRVRRARRVRSFVVDPNDEPISNAAVAVVAAKPGTPLRRLLDAGDVRKPNLLESDSGSAWMWDRGQTNENGVVLLNPPRLDGYASWMVVTVPHYPPRAFAFDPDATEVRCGMEPGATLLVHVRGNWPDHARVRFVKLSDGTSISSDDPAIVIGEAQKLESVVLSSPGIWECLFSCGKGYELPLKQVTLEPGRDGQCDLDGDELLWPTTKVSVNARGIAVERATVIVSDGSGDGGREVVVECSQGAATLPPLPKAPLWIRYDAASPPQLLDRAVWTMRLLNIP